jgi:hypothetical protein
LEGLKLGLSTLIETLLCRSKFQGTTTLIQKYTGRFYFNPFLESHNQLIPPAKYDGTVLKTPMVNLGKAIKLSSWDERVRIEHAMIHGFLKA